MYTIPQNLAPNVNLSYCLDLMTLGNKLMKNRYMAEWIPVYGESWDLEAMTSYNREIGVRGPVGTSRLEFFHPGFTPTVFLH